MELILERKIHNTDSTEGNLYVDSAWFCNTIEDKVRARPGEWRNEVKVYGKTAIPYGRYPVLVTWSNRFKRMLTGVFNVPGFEVIRIHNGTSEKSSAGCIIVSFKDDDKNHKLINDKKAMNDLCKKVEAAQKKGKVWITIVDKKEDAPTWVVKNN
jgi:hypothetical protein